MQFFTIKIFQHWVLAYFLGSAAVILTILAFGLRRHGPERGEDLVDLNEDRGSHLNRFRSFRENPHGLFLLIVYLGVLAWIVAYYFIVGLGARAIW